MTLFGEVHSELEAIVGIEGGRECAEGGAEFACYGAECADHGQNLVGIE